MTTTNTQEQLNGLSLVAVAIIKDDEPSGPVLLVPNEGVKSLMEGVAEMARNEGAELVGENLAPLVFAIPLNNALARFTDEDAEALLALPTYEPISITNIPPAVASEVVMELYQTVIKMHANCDELAEQTDEDPETLRKFVDRWRAAVMGNNSITRIAARAIEDQTGRADLIRASIETAPLHQLQAVFAAAVDQPIDEIDWDTVTGGNLDNLREASMWAVNRGDAEADAEMAARNPVIQLIMDSEVDRMGTLKPGSGLTLVPPFNKTRH